MRAYSKNNLLATKSCRKPNGDGTRYQENVLFTDNSTVATNGHMLIEIQAPKGGQSLDSGREVIIHTSDLPKLKEKQEMVIDRIDTNKEEAHIRILQWKAGQTLASTVKSDIIPLSDGFPAYEHLQEKYTEKPKYRVAFNPKYLKTIADIFDKAGCESVVLTLFEEEGEPEERPFKVHDYNADLDPYLRETPVLFRSYQPNQEIKVLLMPVKVDISILGKEVTK